MSTDLELCQELPKIRIPGIKIPTATTTTTTTFQSCSRPTIKIHQKDQLQDPISKTTTNFDDDQSCRTPKSEENKIPAVLSCPPAPRKPRRPVLCKRKLSEFDFFEIVRRPEVDAYFQSGFEAVGKRIKQLPLL